MGSRVWRAGIGRLDEMRSAVGVGRHGNGSRGAVIIVACVKRVGTWRLVVGELAKD
jgi:hypothetical protein